MPPLKSQLIELRPITAEERERLHALPDANAQAQTILLRVRRDVRAFRLRCENACPSLVGDRCIAKDLGCLSVANELCYLDGELIVAVPKGLAREAKFATAEDWRKSRTAEIVDLIALVAFKRGVDVRADALATLKAMDLEPCGRIAGQFLPA